MGGNISQQTPENKSNYIKFRILSLLVSLIRNEQVGGSNPLPGSNQRCISLLDQGQMHFCFWEIHAKKPDTRSSSSRLEPTAWTEAAIDLRKIAP